MAKILVRATEDFFDRANQSVRKRSSEFALKSEYSDKLGQRVVKIGEYISIDEPVVKKEPGKPCDMDSSRIKRAVRKK